MVVDVVRLSSRYQWALSDSDWFAMVAGFDKCCKAICVVPLVCKDLACNLLVNDVFYCAEEVCCKALKSL
jgi:hypothetical protein